MAFVAAAAFNLVCATTQTTYAGEGAKGWEVQYQLEMRVDLTTKRYCIDRCLETKPIFSVSSVEIVFNRSHAINGAKTAFSDEHVSRETGRYELRSGVGDFVIVRTGACHVAPFTGFPARKL